jgi:hypothetical protein
MMAQFVHAKVQELLLHTVFVKARCNIAHACELGFPCVGHLYGVFGNAWMSSMVYACAA